MATAQDAVVQVPSAAAKSIQFLDGLSVWSGKCIAWLLLPMVAAIIYEVVMRYMFNAPTIWAMDVMVILYGIHFMLGSPYCLQQGQHVRGDFLYNRWSTRKKAVVDMGNYLIFFFPLHIVFLQVGWDYAYKSYQLNEVAISSPWMPIIWPAKMAIPICVFLSLLQGISEFIKCYYRWKLNADLWSTEGHGGGDTASTDTEPGVVGQ